MRLRNVLLYAIALPFCLILGFGEIVQADEVVTGGVYQIRFSTIPRNAKPEWRVYHEFELTGDIDTIGKKAKTIYWGYIWTFSTVEEPNPWTKYMNKPTDHFDLFILGYYKEKTECAPIDFGAVSASHFSGSHFSMPFFSVSLPEVSTCTSTSYFEEAGYSLETGGPQLSEGMSPGSSAISLSFE